MMPTPLLEQTRCVLRSRFSSVIRKRVFTLQFDRSCEDSRDEVLALLAKLDAARRQVYKHETRGRNNDIEIEGRRRDSTELIGIFSPSFFFFVFFCF